MSPGLPTDAELDAAALTGTKFALWAGLRPDRVAVVDPDGTEHSFGHVNGRANRLVRLLRARGLTAGDAVALVCSNRVEFVEVHAACLRAGFRLTPVNWHLTADEIGYIVQDCEAKAVVAEAGRAPVEAAMAQAPGVAVRLAVGGAIAGFEDYGAALAGLDATDIPDPVAGGTMMYTSGTTGRPKGVYRPNAAIIPQALYTMRGYDPIPASSSAPARPIMPRPWCSTSARRWRRAWRSSSSTNGIPNRCCGRSRNAG